MRKREIACYKQFFLFSQCFPQLYIVNKSENATLLLLVEMAEKRFLFQFLFCKIKYLASSYHLFCTRVWSK